MRTGAFVAILRKGRYETEILLADRADGKGFNLIGGKVEDGEEPEEAAEREALEETGLIVAIHREIGESILGMEGGEHKNTVRLYAAEVVGGVLKTTEESRGFIWATVDALANIKLAPFSLVYPACPLGVTYGMAERALGQGDAAVFSAVPDPDHLAPAPDSEERPVVEITLWLPVELDQKLQGKAREMRISVEELITRTLEETVG